MGALQVPTVVYAQGKISLLIQFHSGYAVGGIKILAYTYEPA